MTTNQTAIPLYPHYSFWHVTRCSYLFAGAPRSSFSIPDPFAYRTLGTLGRRAITVRYGEGLLYRGCRISINTAGNEPKRRDRGSKKLSCTKVGDAHWYEYKLVTPILIFIYLLLVVCFGGTKVQGSCQGWYVFYKEYSRVWALLVRGANNL